MIEQPEARPRRGAVVVALVVVGAIVVALAVVGAVTLLRGSTPSASVTLDPARDPGPDPFTPSVTIAPVGLSGQVRVSAAGVRRSLPVDPATHTLAAKGTAPGLYGGTQDAHVCNPQQVVTFLAGHPDKAAAWAGVLGISTKGIGAYVAHLTPVILTSDTLVTNHGYHDGKATSLESVLQAGTAVMVDATGVPRVKCNCGNPLTAPEAITVAHATRHGSAWSGYAANAVTVVRPGRPAKQLTLVDITSGDTFAEPVAGSGAGTWALAAPFESAHAAETSLDVSPDGRSWTPAVPDETTNFNDQAVEALAWGDGTWVAVSWNHDTQSSAAFQSSDLRTWTPAGTHIGGSGSSAAGIGGLAYGNGRWVVTGTVGTDPSSGAGGHAVAYWSSDLASWAEVDLGQGPGSTAGQIAFGQGKFVVETSRPDPNTVTPGDSHLLTSTDGEHWTTATEAVPAAGGAALGFGGGKWILAPFSANTTPALVTSSDGTSWTKQAPIAAMGTGSIARLAYGDGRWLAAMQPAAGPDGLQASAIFQSTDGVDWTLIGSDSDGDIGAGSAPSALAYGQVPGSTTVPGATTTTSPAIAPQETPTTAAGSDVSSLPPGLKCKDLAARGDDFAAAYAYWDRFSHPADMDADHNGIPCETVYPAAAVSAYLAAHGIVAPTTIAGSTHPCQRDNFLLDFGEGDHVAIDGTTCHGDWAIMELHDSQSGYPLATLLFQWSAESSGWVRVMPGADTPDCTGTVVPTEFRSYACGTS